MCDIIMARLNLKVFPHSDVYGEEDLSHLSMFFYQNSERKIIWVQWCGDMYVLYQSEIQDGCITLSQKKNPTNNFVHS